MDRTAVDTEIKTFLYSHIAKNCKHYFFGYCDNQPKQSGFGIMCDPPPFEGKVIHISEHAIYVKLGRNKFKAVDKSLVLMIPNVGEKVKVTPYARRHFDGSRIDAPRNESYTLEDGTIIKSEVFTLGASKTELPVSHEEYQCFQLNEMINQLEQLSAPDGFRSISQMLFDAGAKDFNVVDPLPEDIIKVPPRIKFSVNNTKFSGQVEIQYDCAIDLYRVILRQQDDVLMDTAPVVTFDDLSEVLYQAIDDGSWNKIQIEVIN